MAHRPENTPLRQPPTANTAAIDADYLEWTLGEQKPLLRNVLIAAIIVSIGFFLTDLRLEPWTREAYALARAGFTLCFIVALYRLLSGGRAKQVMAWISAASIGYTVFISIRFVLGHGLTVPPGHLAVDVLIIFAFYLMYQPLPIRVAVGLMISGSSAFDYIVHQGLSQAGIIVLLLTLAFVNIMGFAVARGTERTLRARYESLREIDLLRSSIPICAWCKSIRTDAGIWERLETYLEKNADMMLTHGVCPSCMAAVEAEGEREDEQRQQS